MVSRIVKVGLTLMKGSRLIHLFGLSFFARLPRGFIGFPSPLFRALAHTNANGATRGSHLDGATDWACGIWRCKSMGQALGREELSSEVLFP